MKGAIMRSRRGMSLAEVMVTAMIFAFVFGAILVVMTASDISWGTGQHKLAEQQEARRVMDNVVQLLRQTRPEWVTISASGFPDQDKILFYNPVFDANGLMNPGDWIGVRPVAANNTQIEITKDSGGAWQTIAQKNSSIRFGAGCANCASYNCSSPALSCPTIRIDMRTLDDRGFNMTTYVTLRNYDSSGSGGGAPVPPGLGEF